MNLLLLREGYQPVAVRPEDRKEYLDTLQFASMEKDMEPFQRFMHGRLDATLGGVFERFAGGAAAGCMSAMKAGRASVSRDCSRGALFWSGFCGILCLSVLVRIRCPT